VLNQTLLQSHVLHWIFGSHDRPVRVASRHAALALLMGLSEGLGLVTIVLLRRNYACSPSVDRA
jgi:hypothetical protein